MFKRKKKGSEFWLVQGLKKEEEDKKEINPTIPAELINDNFLRGVTRNARIEQQASSTGGRTRRCMERGGRVCRDFELEGCRVHELMRSVKKG